MDVIGYHLEDIHHETLAEILALWPRGDFKQEVHALLASHAKNSPNSPLGVQWKLGFGNRVLKAPLG